MPSTPALFVAILALSSPCAGQGGSTGPSRQAPAPLLNLYALTRDTFGPGPGELVSLSGNPPVRVQHVAATNGDLRLRSFGHYLYSLDERGGTLTRVRRDGRGSQLYPLGAASMPQDVLVHAGHTAWVTRLEEPRLLRVDLPSGVLTESVDLSPLVPEGATPTLRTLELDGRLLFVQVALDLGGGKDRGLLAVVDVLREELFDVDPVRDGVQGIELQGAPPQLPMQIVDETRTLFVSTTLGRLDNRGGIEEVDLETLRSVGFALTEETVSADIGGFVMISPTEGYFVSHTDIVPSTHVARFSIDDTRGPELFFLLGDAVEVIVHDPHRGLLYVPSGFADLATVPGIYALDTATDELIPESPFATPMKPQALVLAR